MKKKCLLVTLLLSLFFLCSCGVELTGNVKLNKDFSGTRTMSCTFSSREFAQFFQGTAEDLDKVIKDSCPSQLTYKKSSSENQTTYTFSLNFSSLKDYKEKTEAILNFAPNIKYQYGDSPFVSGLIYKENFSSKDLMAWLYTALYEKKYVDKQSVDDLWNLKKTTISFLGKTYETENKISIDEMKYAPLSSINIDTKETGNGSLKRTISFYIPQKTLDQNTGKIRSYFSGSAGTWSNWKNGKILSISFVEDNFTDLAASTRRVLHSKSSNGTYDVICKEKNPFSFRLTYKETLDFSNFINESGNIPVTYTFNGKEQLKDSIKEKTLTFTSDLDQPVSSYDIITVWKNKDDIRRSLTFWFDSKCNKRQLSCLKDAFTGTTISKVTLSKEKQMVLSVSQNGSVKDCNQDISKILKGTSLTYSSKNSFLRGEITTFEDAFSFSSSNKKVHGSYTFVTVSKEESSKITVTPKSAVRSMESQNLSDRDVARLLQSDETIKSLVRYDLSGDSFRLTYEGNTAASHWTSILKILLPLVALVIVGILVFWKQAFLLLNLRKAKSFIEKKLENLNQKFKDKH